MSGEYTGVRSAVVEREFAHPPEKIWRALTKPHLIAEWLMQNDFAPAIGHRFKLRGEWGGVLDCEVLAIEPGRELSYTWDFAHEDPTFELKSVVTFTLVPTPAGTRLRLSRRASGPIRSRLSAGRGPVGRSSSGNSRMSCRDKIEITADEEEKSR